MLLICSCNEKNVSQTVKCSLGQIIIYFFHNLHEILFWPDVCKHFVHIFFFANDSAECCGCPFFYIFSRHYKHCRYLKYNTWVTQFLIQKKIMIMNPCHIRSAKSKSNSRKYCIETAKNSHTSKIWVKSS